MWQSKQTWISFLPLGLFCVLVFFLWRGLYLKPQVIPSVMLNKRLPTFRIVNLYEQKEDLSDALLRGEVSLLHVWASWCLTCRAEHAYLMEIARKHHLAIYAIDYQDNRMRAKAWLEDYGNPYRGVAFDAKGKLGMELGVYGTPETFIIDKNGVIRYKRVGVINRDNWRALLLPQIQKLRQEAAR